MLSKRVDATLGAFWNYEGVELERRAQDPTIIRVDEARRADLQRADPRRAARTTRATAATLLRRFMQALARGHEALREDPAPAVDALLRANPDLDRGLQRAVVEATLPVFFPERHEQPFGWQEPARRGSATASWMAEQRAAQAAATTPARR